MDTFSSVMASITCDHTFEDVDFLLRRNWFFDSQSIIDLLHELPEDIFLQVWDQSQSYPEPVRTLLTDHAKVPPTRYKIRDQSITEIETEYEERTMRRFYLLNEHKAAFQSPPRPRQSIDDTFDSIQMRLNKKRATVEELKNLYVRTRRYVPPSQRKNLTYQDDPVIRDSIAELAILENEFATIADIVTSNDKTWSELAWIDAALVDAAKRPSFLSNVPATVSSA